MQAIPLYETILFISEVWPFFDPKLGSNQLTLLAQTKGRRKNYENC